MINLFQLAPEDQSIYYLGQIFGYVGTVLPVSDDVPLILGVMFKTFNSIVLTVGALIIIYVTVVGVMKTAAEGEFLGKQWNSIWLPIRMVLGIAALVPSTTGYSAIQIVMMWVIVQGIGAADTVWTTVLKYVQVMGSTTATVPVVPSGDLSVMMKTLFQGLTCQAAAASHSSFTDSEGSFVGGYYCAQVGRNDQFCTLSDDQLLNIKRVSSSGRVSEAGGTYQMGPGGACGTVSYCNASTDSSVEGASCADTTTESGRLKCEVCKTQQTTLQNIVTVLGGLAKTFVDVDLSYRQFYKVFGPQSSVPGFVSDYCAANNISADACCRGITIQIPGLPEISTPCKISQQYNAGDYANANEDTVRTIYWPYAISPSIEGANFVRISISNYTTAIGTMISDMISARLEDTTLSDPVLLESQRYGWIFAGAYYYNIAKRNNENQRNVTPSLVVSTSDPTTNPANILNLYRNNYQAAKYLVSSSFGSLSGAGAVLPPQLKGLSELSDSMSSFGSDIMTFFMQMLTGGGPGEKVSNPLVTLQNLGFWLLIIAQIVLALVIIVIPTLTLLGYLSVYALGTGFDNPIGPTVTTLSIIFTPIFSLFLGAFFMFGASLAIYVPLIPYVIFTFGAFGWFIAVIEAMVAAPLVALGLLIPGGQHELLGKAEHALMLIFNIFLRPSLMIFGLIAATLLAMVGVMMVNAGFLGVASAIYQNPGPVEVILFLAAYVSIILLIINKSYSLIHLIPDRVLRWIGGHPEGTGMEEAGLGAAEKGVAGGAGGVQATGKQAAGKADQAKGEWMKEGKRQQEEYQAKKKGMAESDKGAQLGGGKKDDKK